MPGFFDFTNPMSEINPGANSPMMDDVEQAGSYDFAANLPQPSSPQPTDGGVPYNALAAMQGIQMPQMPQQDAMGRYGVTDEQYGDAGRQSLASILRGAAGTMFNDRPDDVMAAAAGSGDIRRGALDKASLENVNAFKLQVEAKAKELDFISKKTDIQKQQMAIDAEAMKLEDLKLKRQVAIQWGKEMAPVMSETLRKTAEMYGTDKANAVRAGFINAQAKLALGDVDGAQSVYDQTIVDLPHEIANKAEEDMAKASLIAANKYQLGLHLSQDPNFLKIVDKVQGRVEFGDDGMPHLVTKSEIEIENLRKTQIQEQIASERARQASYANPGGGVKGTLSQKQINDYIDNGVKSATQVLNLSKPGGIRLEENKAKDEKELADARGGLAPFGLADATPEEIQRFISMTNEDRAKLLYRSGGAVQGSASPQGGAGGPAPVPGGMPGLNPGIGIQSVAIARKGMVDAANKGPVEKKAAVLALQRSGDSTAIKLIQQGMKDPTLNDPVKMWEYLAKNMSL